MSESEAVKGRVRIFVTPSQIKREVAFSDNNLSGAMMEQASLYSYYGAIVAQAQRQVDGFENELAVKKATVANALRDRAAALGTKTTEAAIADRVICDPEVQQITKWLIDARTVHELIRQTCEAFKQRRDMLVQVGKRQLEELEGQLRLGVKDPSALSAVKQLAAQARGAAVGPV